MATSYQITGDHAELLENPALKYLLTNDRALGSTNDQVPDGAINRELWKLLQNDGALAALFYKFNEQTYGAQESAAPTAGTVPDPLPGASVTPAAYDMHTVYYNDYQVLYQYDGDAGEWVEKVRRAKVLQVASHHRATVTVAIGTGESDVAIPIPTEDDDETEVAFTIADLKIVYVNNLDEEAPVIGLVTGYQLSGATVRALLTEAAAEDNDYEIVAIFEKLILV